MGTSIQLRAKAELELRNRDAVDENPFAQYRFDPIRYIIDKLNWHPWAGDGDHPGQVEVLQAYELALRQLHERYDYEQGTLTADELVYWKPGQVIKNRIRVEAGHTVGKSKVASGIFSHFFDLFSPAIIYSYAPSYEQINDLLWKEIRTDRRNNDLPGRVLETPELKLSGDHFAKGRATNDSHGKGTERSQGQHGKYLMFIIDEAEGVADFVFKAIESMASGGIVIVLMLANPRTRTSQFYKQRTRENTQSFRISCVYHPNVLADREVVPNAVRREYVENMIDSHCEIVDKQDADHHTFEVPWRPGIIYKPDAEMMFRVLGIAPKNLTERSFVSTGRFEAAVNRQPMESEPDVARIGIDVARYGTDAGTIYPRWNGKIWRHAQIQGQDTNAYRDSLRELCVWLKANGVKRVDVRVDGGGGFASGIIDPLKRDLDFKDMFQQIRLVEVNFGGTPKNDKKYANLVTEMYAEAAETLTGYTIVNPPNLLEEDLSDRLYEPMNKGGREVRKLEEKEQFRKRHEGRSPDDGDGFVLAAAPDHIFKTLDPASLVGFA